MSDSSGDVTRAMDVLKRTFQPDKAAGVDAIVQYVLTGPEGGEFYCTIKNKELALVAGKAPSARITMTMGSKDFLEMTTGKLSSMTAFTSGKLKVGGDMMFGMKLMPIFKFG